MSVKDRRELLERKLTKLQKSAQSIVDTRGYTNEPKGFINFASDLKSQIVRQQRYGRKS